MNAFFILKLCFYLGYPLAEYWIGKNKNIDGNSVIEVALNKIEKLFGKKGK